MEALASGPLENSFPAILDRHLQAALQEGILDLTGFETFVAGLNPVEARYCVLLLFKSDASLRKASDVLSDRAIQSLLRSIGDAAACTAALEDPGQRTVLEARLQEDLLKDAAFVELQKKLDVIKALDARLQVATRATPGTYVHLPEHLNTPERMLSHPDTSIIAEIDLAQFSYLDLMYLDTRLSSANQIPEARPFALKIAGELDRRYRARRF